MTDKKTDKTTYWIIDATIIGQFDSEEEAIEALEKESTMVEIAIGDKIVHLPKDKIGICPEELLP